MSLQDLIQEARSATGLSEAMPADVDRYYRKCRKDYPNKGKEYCARVAWHIYCTNKNPDYAGCTKYGKTKAVKEPLSQSVQHEEDCGCGG